ncbi:MAG: hypothetical protein LBQ81_09760 [Zoogloeaceae bacterium]|jgi:hypothetical protein|nr:hypothetical protein [Zoogloeaceae bacterium]
MATKKQPGAAAPLAAVVEAPLLPDLPPAVIPHLRVRAFRAGHRRAGRAWPTEGVTVAVDEFSKDQVLALMADPNLSVDLIGAVE